MKVHCLHAGTGLYTGASGYFLKYRESVSVISESTPQTPSLNAYVAFLYYTATVLHSRGTAALHLLNINVKLLLGQLVKMRSFWFVQHHVLQTFFN